MDFTLSFFGIFGLDLIHAGPILFLLLLTILLIGYAVGKLENWDNFDAIYFAFVTATTLGYGDFRPKRRYSKLLAIALALIGIMFTGMIVAIALHAGNFAFEEVY